MPILERDGRDQYGDAREIGRWTWRMTAAAMPSTVLSSMVAFLSPFTAFTRFPKTMRTAMRLKTPRAKAPL